MDLIITSSLNITVKQQKNHICTQPTIKYIQLPYVETKLLVFYKIKIQELKLLVKLVMRALMEEK